MRAFFPLQAPATFAGGVGSRVARGGPPGARDVVVHIRACNPSKEEQPANLAKSVRLYDAILDRVADRGSVWVIAPAMCGDSKLLGHLRQRYGAEMRSRISRGGGGSAACFGLQAGVDCTLNDFRFMALARTLVVAEGSTFSFWAALLAANATQVHVINPLKDNPKGKFVAHDQRDRFVYHDGDGRQWWGRLREQDGAFEIRYEFSDPKA